MGHFIVVLQCFRLLNVLKTRLLRHGHTSVVDISHTTLAGKVCANLVKRTRVRLGSLSRMSDEKDPSNLMSDEQRPPAQTQEPSSSQAEAAATPSQADGPNEKKARDYIDQAERKVKSASGFLGNIFG